MARDQHVARIDVTWQPSASIGEAEQVVRLVQGVATSMRENLRRWDLTGLDVTLHIDPPDGMAAGPQATPPLPEVLGEYETVGPKGALWSVIPTSVQALQRPPGTRVQVVAVPTDHEDRREPAPPEDGKPWTPLSDAVRRSRGGPAPRRPGGFA